MAGQRSILAKYANISEEDIRGSYFQLKFQGEISFKFTWNRLVDFYIKVKNNSKIRYDKK